LHFLRQLVLLIVAHGFADYNYVAHSEHVFSDAAVLSGKSRNEIMKNLPIEKHLSQLAEFSCYGQV
jgi:hypothetical protein